MKLKALFILFLSGIIPHLVVAQTQTGELNARITINSDKIQGSDKQVFTTLQSALTEFVNNRRWTDATFAINERIDCSMTIIVNEQTDNSFKAEIQVQARRPVYNSSYSTTLFNHRDTEFDFEYVQFEQLEYTENTLSSNLTATIVYYIYDNLATHTSYAAAAAVFLFAVILVFTALQLFVSKKRVYY